MSIELQFNDIATHAWLNYLSLSKSRRGLSFFVKTAYKTDFLTSIQHSSHQHCLRFDLYAAIMAGDIRMLMALLVLLVAWTADAANKRPDICLSCVKQPVKSAPQ